VSLDKSFYRAFEEKFRGPRSLIKSRLQVYLEFVEPLKSIYTDLSILDLGCGRGEWLELMDDFSFYVHGVDINESMLLTCKDLKLSCSKSDSLKYLKELPDESLVIVSAFHLIEHLSIDDLISLVAESKRVLKNCGLLIIETPNPENLIVGTNNFYLDPTHKRPIPGELLLFIVEHFGFSRVKLLRLQENIKTLYKENLGVLDIINGVSPDYAIIAQKEGAKEDLLKFDNAFSKEFGISLTVLGEKYDENVSRTKNIINKQLSDQGKQLSELRQLILLIRSIKWIINLPIRLIKKIVTTQA
jgi:SAM-dependent methyltransferase